MSGTAIRYQSITAIGSFTAFSISDADDYLALDPARCSGGADAPLRTTIEPKPDADGVFIEAPFDDAQIITLAGDLVITSNGASSESGYFTALDTLLASLKSALDALKTASGDLTHAGGTIQVWKQAPLETTWQNYYVCSVTFGLVVDVG